MKLRIPVVLALSLFFVLALNAQTDNTLYVRNFKGGDVGAKVTAAMATCNPSTVIPCILVIDPSLASYAAGTIPTMCSHCYVVDYRTGPPVSSAAGCSGSLGNLSCASVAATTFNGVPLSTSAGSGAFLNGAGGYSTPSGNSVQIKYLSVQNCPQDSDPNAGGGTDATACINALLAGATPTNPIIVFQDKGFSLISGAGIHGPAGGNWAIEGNGGGIATTQITNCSIAGGVAIFTTLPNALMAGQTGTLAHLAHCPGITNTTVTVLAAGLSSTQFEVSAGGTVTSGAETGTFRQVFGTGFFMASASNGDAISNGSFYNFVPASGGCSVATSLVGAPVPSQGANILLRDFVINGNANGQSTYCFGAHLVNINGLMVDDVTFYNASHFSLTLDNVSSAVIHGNKFFSSSNPIGTNTDGVHIDGPGHHISISDNYFKTGDDALALNAVEGYCGPIKNVAISNNTFDNAFTAMRMYNLNMNTCPGNGLVPLISYIDWTNNSGTVASHPFMFGLGGSPYSSGTLYPAMAHIHLANSTLNSPASAGSAHAFEFDENFDDITIANFTIDSPNQVGLIQIGPGNTCALTAPNNVGFFGRLAITNLTVSETLAGSVFTNLYNLGQCMTGGTISVNGFATDWSGGATPVSQGPLFQDIGAITSASFQSLLGSNIDTTNVTLDNGHYSNWIPSKVPHVMVFATNGLVTDPMQTYGTNQPYSTSFSGMLGTFGGGASSSANCTFGGIIAPTTCAAVWYNGAVHYIPMK